jgi:hypothetical protein
MTKVPTYIATIYVGLKYQYDGDVMPFEEAERVIQEWVDKIGMCVTVTRTNYIYTKGNEPGLIIGFINYPRFPSTPEEIQFKALDLAQILLKEYKQMQLSIVFPEETIMISNKVEITKYLESKLKS